MISKFNLSKALLNNAKTYADANGYTLVSMGSGYSPAVDETYITEAVIFGDDVRLGYSNASNSVQRGIYQLNVNTPKINSGSKRLGLKIIDELQTAFSNGLQLTFDSQIVEIKSSSAVEMTVNDTHNPQILNIYYTVIN